MRCSARARHHAFTLIEVLVVIGIIAVLGAMLLPAMSEARVAARVSRAHGELRQVTVALQMYRHHYNVFPPARTFCASQMPNIDDYNHLPPELVSGRCIDSLPEDIFNPGHTYKYIAPGLGWANGDLSILAIWVPNEFPKDTGQETPYFDQHSSPVKCAVWSVGPSGPRSVFDSDALRYPVPPRHWYPNKRDGIIVHHYRSGCWHSSP